jgi:hypothetical protein
MNAGPWFRKQDGWWYFYRREDGVRRQIRLVQGEGSEKAAIDRWHELCRTPADQPLVVAGTVVAYLEVYLDWCEKNLAPSTYGIYRHHLQSFCTHIGGAMTVESLKPKHVTSWLGKIGGSDSTKAGAAQTVRTAFNWLVREGHIPASPVGGPTLRSPPAAFRLAQP